MKAFKEWGPMVAELAAGRQVVILRKGGIAEGRGGFAPVAQGERFWLWPTEFHASAEKVRGEVAERWARACDDAEAEGGEITRELIGPERGVMLRYAARLEQARWLQSWEQVLLLAPFHGWQEEVLRERFCGGGESGIWLLLVRVERAAVPVHLPWQQEYGGCKSWVELDGEDGRGVAGRAVMSAAEFQRECGAVLAALG